MTRHESTYHNSGVLVDAYDIMGKDKSMYYGQIQKICELDFHGFKIPLFRCNWVDAHMGAVKISTGSLVLTLTVRATSRSLSCSQNTWLNFSMFLIKKDLMWLYLRNDESSESRMLLMRKSLIS
jgi:hypothetical protein